MARTSTQIQPATDEEAAAICEVNETRTVLEQVVNKWSILILSVLCERPARFNQLMRRLDGITHKALSEALKRLERNGLVKRTVLADATPIGVEYTITPLGRSLKEPFAALREWALVHGPELERAQLAFDDRA